MSSKNPYQLFDKYVLRTPTFSFTKYKKFTSQKLISDDDFKILCRDRIFKEAVYIASPIFYNEMEKWVNDEIDDINTAKKIKITVLKYFSRMSSRCTPFGLFSGCSVGEFSNNTELKLDQTSNFKRHTRLDMHYLVALSQNLAKNPEIENQILFYPNNSIYKIGDKIRFVEYHYIKGQRKHEVVAVDDSEYLNLILEKSKNGCLLVNLAEELVQENIPLDEAINFINELIDSQLLISELEPSVSGPEFIDQICEVLKEIEGKYANKTYTTLIAVNERLATLDLILGNDPSEYIKISEILKELGTEFKLNYLFQTDTVLLNKKNRISKKLGNDVLQAFNLLNKLTLKEPTTKLSKFKDSFFKRYESREVHLSKVLDIELGIGYRQDQKFGDLNPLIDDLLILHKNNENQYYDVKWSAIDTIFQEKFHNKSLIIQLEDEDFPNLDISWNDLPDTMSTIAELIFIDNEEKIKISTIGGPTATMLLGRFGHSNPEIHNLLTEIIKVEDSININDDLLAEIIHLPESRVGNVIMRPELRQFEIPYLAKSIKPEKNQLLINDLTVSISDDRGDLLLKSFKYNKIVKPKIASAHNYSNNSLPIYNFLCDMQTQGMRQGLGLFLNPLFKNYNFIPRIEYKNLILQDAIWNLRNKDIIELLNVTDDDVMLDKKIIAFRAKLHIPQFVMFIENDNELIINFENLNSVRMFLSSIRNLSEFQISEFLFSEKGVVSQNEDYFTNQVIISFFNEEKLKKANAK